MMNSDQVKNIINNGKNTEPMPLLFVGHGSPMNALEENDFVASWRNLANTIPRPEAILCISAHWETNGTFVTAMQNPPTIHDFGGFPDELYKVQYPAPGSPELAFDIKRSVKSVNVGLDEKWGLDHGSWSVIRNIYPKADIPVIEMSMDWNKSPQAHYDLAKELAPLREKGVLIIGSGNMVHNLRMIAWDHVEDPEYGYDWAIEANEKFKKLILNNDHKDLINYPGLGSDIMLAVPTPDHFLPLLYTLALKNKNESLTFFNDKAVMGSLSMTSLRFG
jgi:4,5-DOPA dioxygenase extradiol